MSLGNELTHSGKATLPHPHTWAHLDLWLAGVTVTDRRDRQCKPDSTARFMPWPVHMSSIETDRTCRTCLKTNRHQTVTCASLTVPNTIYSNHRQEQPDMKTDWNDYLICSVPPFVSPFKILSQYWWNLINKETLSWKDILYLDHQFKLPVYYASCSWLSFQSFVSFTLLA